MIILRYLYNHVIEISLNILIGYGIIMQEIPEKVSETFYRLKETMNFRIVLQKRNGHYYVYKASTWWDKKEKKVKSSQQYIGRITEYGAFIKRAEEYEKSELERARTVLEAHGAVVSFPGEQTSSVTQQQPAASTEEEISEIDKKILMCLSMNARMPMSKMAKIVGISEQNAYYRVKALEKKFGIRYLLELDMEKLGFTTYFILIKFEGDIPSPEELKQVFNNESRVQFAATMKGDYDLLAYVLDENSLNAEDNLWKIMSDTSLMKYKARWYLIPFGQVYSFVPLREEFIENIIKQQEWHRTKDNAKPKQEELKHREFILLKEFNKNSVIGFATIDKKYKLNNGASRYTYEELEKEGIIIRSTITMENVPLKYISLVLIETISPLEVKETRHKLLLNEFEYGPITNRYVLMGNMSMPESAALFMPVLNEEDLDLVATDLKKQLKGVVIRISIVTNMLVGSLCYRRFDNNYSRQYESLIKLDKLKPVKHIAYD